MIPGTIFKHIENNRIDDEDEDEDEDDDDDDVDDDVGEDNADTVFDDTEIKEGMNTLYKDEIFNSNNNSIINTSREYKYDALKLLYSDLEYHTREYSKGKIHICPYQVNTTGLYPFLQFIMRKYKNDIVTFHSIDFDQNTKIMEMCDGILNIIIMSYFKTGSYKYKGFVKENNNFYVFFDFSSFNIESHNLSRTNDLWLVLIDEIVNHKSICNFKIEQSVVDFFINNPEFTLLKDIHNNYYESPIVAYSGNFGFKINFELVFGISTSSSDLLTGSYYYFTDYINAIKKGGWTKKQLKDDGGIIRLAIFPGNMKLFVTENKNEIWTDAYDSVYIGHDNGGPQWVLKMYEQQTPLSSHYIDKSNLGEKWDVNNNYFIK